MSLEGTLLRLKLPRKKLDHNPESYKYSHNLESNNNIMYIRSCMGSVTTWRGNSIDLLGLPSCWNSFGIHSVCIVGELCTQVLH